MAEEVISKTIIGEAVLATTTKQSEGVAYITSTVVECPNYVRDLSIALGEVCWWGIHGTSGDPDGGSFKLLVDIGAVSDEVAAACSMFWSAVCGTCTKRQDCSDKRKVSSVGSPSPGSDRF